MYYYGISVVITILLTSMMAFYLLYKARELNLGVVISISIGSVVLGFTFSPVYKGLMYLLSENISLNKKIALVISIFIVLVIFLLFILIISVVISFCIPKKFSSIDCCVIIDGIIAKMNIKADLKNIKEKVNVFTQKLIGKMKDLVKNVYTLKNKLKKPVDTKQIIDTMGIEKSENSISDGADLNTDSIKDTAPFGDLMNFMEPGRELQEQGGLPEPQASEIEPEFNEIVYAELAAAFEEEAENEISIEEMELEDELIHEETSDQDIGDSPETEIQIPERADEEAEYAGDAGIDNELSAADDLNRLDTAEQELAGYETPEAEETAQEAENEADEAENGLSVADDLNGFDTEDQELIENEIPQFAAAHEAGNKADEDEFNKAEDYVLKAFECKDEDNKVEAVEYYMKAMQHQPDNEMVFWIVLDVCALYKQLGLSDLAQIILEGLVNEYGAAIQPEIKEEIMKNLK